MTTKFFYNFYIQDIFLRNNRSLTAAATVLIGVLYSIIYYIRLYTSHFSSSSFLYVSLRTHCQAHTPERRCFRSVVSSLTRTFWSDSTSIHVQYALVIRNAVICNSPHYIYCLFHARRVCNIFRI